MSDTISLFARPPVAGAAKTRLEPALGKGGAAQLYEAFAADCAAHCAAATGFETRLWVAGDVEDAWLVQLAAEHGLARQPQPDGDLGQRLAAALSWGLSNGARTLVLGTDSPTLPTSYLALAGLALGRADLVLGPAIDGGFYLIGAGPAATGPRLARLFQAVRWSTACALADTLQGAVRAQLSVQLLPPWYDVDRPQDLALLRLHLDLAPQAAPSTAKRLAGLVASSPGADF